MPRPREVEDFDVVRAAFLLCQGWSRLDIAASLNISPAKVVQLLDTARGARKIYDVRTRFHWSGLSKEEQARIRELSSCQRLEHSLFEKLVDPYRIRVRVHRSGPRWGREAVRFFADAASQDLAKVLKRSRHVGVAWGETLSCLITSIEKAHGGVWPRRITFFPVLGEPLGAEPLPTSASLLAQRLHTIVNAGCAFDPPTSLAGVPALIPQIKDARERDVVMRFLRALPGHRRIRQLALSMDTLLTSVAPKDKPLGHVGRVVLEQIGLGQKDLRNVVKTEIAGVLLGEQPARDAETESKLAAIIDHRTGIEESDIAACAERARKNKRHGVVVVAVGKEKADSVRECIKRELVNTLIIDEHLAQALLLVW